MFTTCDVPSFYHILLIFVFLLCDKLSSFQNIIRYLLRGLQFKHQDVAQISWHEQMAYSVFQLKILAVTLKTKCYITIKLFLKSCSLYVCYGCKVWQLDFLLKDCMQSGTHG